jgi:cell division protein FtsN
VGAETGHRMKQLENNGIDTLLRGLARRERSFDARDKPDAQGAHLDADELSSYAEGALPAAALARYTSHLADCDDCRALVSQLSLAAGAIINEERLEREAAGGLTWKQKLASLFSPVVWRFAMPALALVVLGFAFFAWQARHKESSEVAMNEQAKRVNATQPGVVANDKGATNKNSGSVKGAPAKAAEQAGKQQDKAGEADTKADSDKTASDESKSASGSASQEEAKQKESEKTEATAASQPADAPAASPAPKPATTEATRERQAKSAKDEEQRDAVAQRNEDDVNSNAAGNVANARKGGPSARRAGIGAQTKTDDDSRAADGADASDRGGRGGNDANETRTVAGRHFHRQNGLWLDTAYKSSQSVTNVARGSEQFRALIADEPEIATIARQLSGEVIVVWKGHTYRIR